MCFCLSALGGRGAGGAAARESHRTGNQPEDRDLPTARERHAAGGTETEGEGPADNHHRVRGVCWPDTWMIFLPPVQRDCKELCIMKVLFGLVFISMQQRVQQGLEDGARLPSLDVEKLRGENNALREEQQKLRKVFVLEMWEMRRAEEPLRHFYFK